ncbi:hypothetical protein [Serratia fonticola]|uniref:hypothetical protein n=1 Tax=Serratia fonticola TaxID=47917 RepID=UPI000E0FF0B3|nr:hypothetical protein [Serratia fonticola]
MNWLISFNTKVDGVETDRHLILQGPSLDIAERAVRFMGNTWWPGQGREDGGHWWCFEQGEVWFSAIVLLDDVEFSVLRGLKFLNLWHAHETPAGVTARDEFGYSWSNYSR